MEAVWGAAVRHGSVDVDLHVVAGDQRLLGRPLEAVVVLGAGAGGELLRRGAAEQEGDEALRGTPAALLLLAQIRHHHQAADPYRTAGSLIPAARLRASPRR